MWITAAVLGAGALSTVGGIISGKKAAKAQGRATDAALQLQREMFDQTREDLQPFIGAGSNALAALEFDLGLRTDAPSITPDVFRPEVERVGRFQVGEKDFNTRAAARQYIQGEIEAGKMPAITLKRDENGRWVLPDGQTFRRENRARNALADQRQGRVVSNDNVFRVGNNRFATEAQAQRVADRRFARNGGELYGGYETSPGYNFRLQEGVDAIDASAGARGGLKSGATLKRLTQFGQDFATSDYANSLQRLFALAGSGQSAAGGAGNAGANFAQQGSNALLTAGQARADAAINTANQFNNFLSNGIGAIGAIGGGTSTAFSPPPFTLNRDALGMLV